ncbi:DUF998 domain-containing protein [Pseudonocardia sp. TRM90224]|uniref:DUF998 domain-containing protein n=1 Tax=Pseudonocardia sp. TRM90224 TaxID=2812678 RepID=UPI001E4B7243|nr:DUF998 domain-containing protein [Pseudonocardia sp. TRM90224]
MHESTRTPAAGRDGTADPSAHPGSTPVLLACGAAAGPLFVLSVVLQESVREGFDPRYHALSQLALGAEGWVQTATFIVAGLLAVASAVGLRRALQRAALGARWGPILIGGYGIGLIWGGLFATDPALGFPPGTPDGMPASMSWHATLHGFAPMLTGLALIAACVVFALRFRRQGRRGWATSSAIVPIAYLALGFAAFPADDLRLLLAGGAIIWLWASALTLRILLDHRGAK